MKKILALLLTLALVFAIVGCTQSPPASSPSPSPSPEASPETEAEVDDDEEVDIEVDVDVVGPVAGAVLTYAEFMAADLDTEVTVETYVQAKQSWWNDQVTVYSQDEDGAYFLYNMVCSQEDDELLEIGTKIRVTGYKIEWAGIIEISDATFEFIDGNYIADALDVTDLLGTDDLIDHMNEFVVFKGLTVEVAGQDDDGEDLAFLYNWDGSGDDGDDLYFNVSNGEETFSFTIRRFLRNSSSEVYLAVKELKVGDVIDAEGFLYWYYGPNPHITSISVVG